MKCFVYCSIVMGLVLSGCVHLKNNPVESSRFENGEWCETLAVTGLVRGIDLLPAAGVQLWAESVLNNPPAYMHQLNKLPRGILEKTLCRTDATGVFIMPNIPANRQYIVKCVTEKYPVQYAGPFMAGTVPQEPIELTIQKFGGRITGICRDTVGNPITNLVAGLGTARGLVIKHYADCGFEYDKDGTFVSDWLLPGQRTINITAPGYAIYTAQVRMHDGEFTEINPVLFSQSTVTGIVVDSETGEPVPGVTLSNIFQL